MAGSDEEALGPEVRGELGRMATELDAEVRAEQAEYEAMALQSAWRARRIVDVAREWMVRGDRVEVAVGGLVLTGLVVHVGVDWLALTAGDERTVDVALAAGPLLRVVQTNPRGRRPPGSGAKTFVARLTEHEVAAAVVEVWLDDGQLLRGVLRAVAVDHVLLDSPQGRRVLPLPRLALVRPAVGGPVI